MIQITPHMRILVAVEPVGQAVACNGGELGRDVGRQGVAHLHRRGQLARAIGQHLGQAIGTNRSGVRMSGEEQHHLVSLQHGDDARGGSPLAGETN